MTQLLLSHSWWPLHSNQVEKAKNSHHITNDVEDLNCSIEVDDNDAVAIIAYVEAIENMAISVKLIDSILFEEIKNTLDSHHDLNDSYNIQQIAGALLPTAKRMLDQFYLESVKHSVNREDVCHCMHQDCEVELLKFLTHIYIKNFIDKYYQPMIAN